MTKIGIGLPGESVQDVRAAAEAVAQYPFDSFSVYGDLGDLPPYAVLGSATEALDSSKVANVGPMGIPVGMIHPEVISGNAITLEEQLPGQTYIGLVRGAFLEQIGETPATLKEMRSSIQYVRSKLSEVELEIPIYIGGFGPKILGLAGELGVAGIKLGGSANPEVARVARERLLNPKVKICMGAVSVVDYDRVAARTRARHEVAKYLDVVGELDPTLNGDQLESLTQFSRRFRAGDTLASGSISDGLLNKFAIAGTPDDVIEIATGMHGVVDRLELGTPHGLGDRPEAIDLIGKTILKEIGGQYEVRSI